MARRYPERSPSRDLIRLWVKQQEPENFRALSQERNERLAERSLDLALRSVDKLEDEVEAGGITGKTLAITFGIATDKVLKIHELAQRSRESDAGQALANAIDRMKDFSVAELNAVAGGTSPDEIIEGKVIIPDTGPATPRLPPLVDGEQGD